ncbi:unnamed protein product [Thelazia callipaeda]|uniref:Tudor domain-containing protein n=1 Tax=Thelazia callipaeda TaxID=103827 RepID=A0A0N5CWG1_THECL|nr:unnamed protein product [Thelazia callipaeda]
MMARTKQPPVSLLMPLDSCFEVRILCIDYNNGFILIRPLTVDDKYVKLRQKLQQQSKMEHCRANYIEEDGIYLVPNDHGLMFRGVLVGQPSENNLFYGIDDGERKVVKAEDTFQLPDELQSFPPSSFCGILPWYTSSSQYEELSSVNTNIICLCKINKVLPGHFMDYPTAMYPPVLFIQLYRLTADNYYIEIISKQKPNSIIHCAEYLWPRIAVFNSSWMGKIDQHIMSNFRRISLSDHEIVQTRIASDNFLFKPYNISLPCQVKAIITRRVRKNIYWMRDANILKILYENLIDPYEHAKYSIVDIIKYGVEFSCLVRLTRPFRDSSLFDRYYVYRFMIRNRLNIRKM